LKPSWHPVWHKLYSCQWRLYFSIAYVRLSKK